jgi:hypothetical protein
MSLLLDVDVIFFKSMVILTPNIQSLARATNTFSERYNIPTCGKNLKMANVVEIGE